MTEKILEARYNPNGFSVVGQDLDEKRIGIPMLYKKDKIMFCPKDTLTISCKKKVILEYRKDGIIEIKGDIK
jgi:hypothetical protein